VRAVRPAADFVAELTDQYREAWRELQGKVIG
jgi:nitronate monooxygenase